MDFSRSHRLKQYVNSSHLTFPRPPLTLPPTTSPKTMYKPTQAFIAPLATAASISIGAFGLPTCARRARRAHAYSTTPRTRTPVMIGPLPGFDGGSGDTFFQSPIVQAEMKNFMQQQQMLGQLGQKYRTFDREGKIAYIDQSLQLIDRWLILLQRFKLSDAFACQMYVKQLETHLQSFGMTTDGVAKNARESLKAMRRDALRE